MNALGHCEDPDCLHSTTTTTATRQCIRVFRCSMHCNRNLCLSHLNAHNIVYEQMKKQQDKLIDELDHYLNWYQSIFQEQIRAYRDLFRQASSLLMQKELMSTPIDEIRCVLDQLQDAIAFFQKEKGNHLLRKQEHQRKK